MATELNHDTIKDAIVTILKANASLFTSTAEANKIRAITTGKPEILRQDAMFPYIIVTNGNPLERIEGEKFVLSDSVRYVEHIIRYQIITIVNEKDSRQAENDLDDYQKLIFESLEGNRDLTSNVDTHDLVSVSDLETITQETHGVRGRVIIMEAVKATGA